MENLFSIDRIIDENVILQNLSTEENITVLKSYIIGDIKEGNIYVKTDNYFNYSDIETKKRKTYIDNLAKDLWN